MEILVLFLVMLLIVFIQSQVFRRLSFKGLDYECAFSTDEAFEGDSIELVETITNRKWLPLPWFKSELTTSKWLDFAGSQSTVTYNTRFVPSLFLIKGHTKVVRRWKVTCRKRGVYSIDTVVLVSTDLLGRQTVSKTVKTGSQVVVLPKTFELSEEFADSRFLQGDHPVRAQLVPDPFVVSGVREYLPSDPMKNIHWNATAKMGRIMIRNQEFTTRQCMLVLLNLQTKEYEKKQAVDSDALENCIRTAASLFDATLHHTLPFAFGCNSSETGLDTEETTFVPYSYGTEYVMSLFRLLARLPEGATLNFARFLKEFEVPEETTDIFLVTAYVSNDIFDYCRLQKEEGRRVKILVLRPETEHFPDDCDVYYLRDEAVKHYAAN